MRRGLVLSLMLLFAGCGGSSGPPRHVVLHVAPPAADAAERVQAGAAVVESAI